MRYTLFSAKNYKGINECIIDFKKPPSGSIYTLVGLNESGKTTILEAMNSFVYGSEDLKAIKILGYHSPEPNELVPIARKDNFEETIEIRYDVELDRADIDSIKKILSREHGYAVHEMNNSIKINDIYHYDKSKYDKKSSTWSLIIRGIQGRERNPRKAPQEVWETAIKNIKDLLPRIIYFPNFLFDFPDKIFLEGQPASREDLEPEFEFYKDFLQDVLNALGTGTNVDDHIIDRIRANDSIDKRNLEALLLKMGRHITDTVFNEWDKIFSSDEKATSNKSIRLEYGIADEDRTYLNFILEDVDGRYKILERSLGFRWFFGYILLTHYRGHRRSGVNDIIYLFDEPASNLHSSAQQRLLESFKKLGKSSTIVYATHSHHLINIDWLENTYVVSNSAVEYEDVSNTLEYSSKKTNICAVPYRRFVDENPSKTTYFQPLLDKLEYFPSKIENVKDVIMLEGKNDYYSLRYYLEVWMGRNLSLLPGVGAGSLTNSIRLYLAWGKKFAILLDSDEEGNKQKRKYIDTFGAVVSDSISVLGDVSSEFKGKGMEYIFLESDRLALQQVIYHDDKKYNKKHFNNAIQELLVKGNKVEISIDTLNNLKKVVDFLKSKIS